MAIASPTDTSPLQPLSAALFQWARERPDDLSMLLPREGGAEQKSWRQLADDVLRMVAHLDALGVGSGDRVVLWGDNSYEWIVLDLAILSCGAIHVPLHGSLPAPAAAAQIAHAEPSVVFTANAAMAEKLRAVPTMGQRRLVELVSPLESEPRLMRRLAAAPLENPRDIVKQRADAFDPAEIATILYSSGTSGEPKAVALTHANLATNAAAVIAMLRDLPRERRMNLLPFSHIYARTCDVYTWLLGGSELVIARSRESVIADCQATRPTLINAVPYFYQRLAQRVADSEGSAAPLTLQQLLGGRIRACFCGGAALPVETFDFYHARGMPLLPGYGLTESSPVIAVSTLAECRRGTVGKPIPDIEVRIAEDGELLTRGPHIMREYWKDPELTRHTIRDGWLHTGDLGSIGADGFVSIVGRKKEMIVLSTGKKAIPTHIEGLLAQEPLILQSVVVGNDQAFLAALVTPNADALAAWLAAAGLSHLDRAAAISHPAVVREFSDRIRRRLADLPPFEQVKRFALLDCVLTIEEGLLTPKLSLRRDAIHRRFQQEISSLYAGGGIPVVYDAPATSPPAN